MTPTIELWYVPDCPLIDRVRANLYECLEHRGLDITVHEREGDYPSPTLIIDGVDVATGTAPDSAVCCRLDLPTHDQIHAALANSTN